MFFSPWLYYLFYFSLQQVSYFKGISPFPLKYQDIFKLSFAYLKTEIKFCAVKFARRTLMYELEVREGWFSISVLLAFARNKNCLTGQLKSKRHNKKILKN